MPFAEQSCGCNMRMAMCACSSISPTIAIEYGICMRARWWMVQCVLSYFTIQQKWVAKFEHPFSELSSTAVNNIWAHSFWTSIIGIGNRAQISGVIILIAGRSVSSVHHITCANEDYFFLSRFSLELKVKRKFSNFTFVL